MSYRDEARRALESESARARQSSTLGGIKPRRSALERFDTIEDLLSFLRDTGAEKDVKDAALLELLREHQDAPSSGAFVILAAAMLPMLDRLYGARLSRVTKREQDDLWSRVFAAFTESVDRYPVNARPKRVAANLRGETLAAMRRAMKSEIELSQTRQAMRVIAPRLDDAPDEKPPRREIDDAGVAGAARRLDGYMIAGLIAEGDRALLLGVYACGRSIGEVARELGINREAAKKRLQRAAARIRIGVPRARPRTDVSDVKGES